MSERRRVRAYIGLGANLGDPTRTLTRAVADLARLPGLSLREVSRLYATAPWGVTDQPEFRNAVVVLDARVTADPEAGALDVLGRLKLLERLAGRRRGRRWGARELDLDLLVYGRHAIDVARTPVARSIDADGDPMKAARRLQVPHRDLGVRLFVLAPLADVAPGLVPPGWHETIETVRRRVAATDPTDSVRVVGTWDRARAAWRRAR